MGQGDKRIELTLRGLALGCLITVVFTAANVESGGEAIDAAASGDVVEE